MSIMVNINGNFKQGHWAVSLSFQLSVHTFGSDSMQEFLSNLLNNVLVYSVPMHKAVKNLI